MTWLNWLLKFHTRLWISSYLTTHTSHKFNVQWMLISFVCCMCSNVMCILNCLLIKPNFFFIVFYMFLKVFLCFYVFRVLSKMSISFLSKKISKGIFVNKSRLNSTCKNETGKFQITLKFRQRVLRLAREKVLPTKIVSMLQWLFCE